MAQADTQVTDISAPLTEPVTLDYAKTFLRVDTDDDDALISDLITSARLRIEQMIGGSLITRARRYRSSRLTGQGVFLAHHPVTEVSALRLIGPDGTTLIPVEAARINLRCLPPVVSLKNRSSFRSYDPSADTLEIEFTAGYGEAPEDVPMPLRQAVLLLLAQSYEYRGEATPPPVPMMVDALLMPYRGLRL